MLHFVKIISMPTKSHYRRDFVDVQLNFPTIVINPLDLATSSCILAIK